jgi:intron-binding protein aquarius
MIPSGNFTGAEVLALPKLNLQFLTFYDYLLKNFTLYRLESTYVLIFPYLAM